MNQETKQDIFNIIVGFIIGISLLLILSTL